jgi:uncharacterized protein (DUF952 family)
MGWYHALAAEHGDKPKTVYHLCPKGDWDDKKPIYFPRAYDADKLTRSMHDASRIVESMNCLYDASKSPASTDPDEDWICLQIDTMALKVHGIELEMVTSQVDPTQQCPHIFGGLPREAVTKVYPVERGSGGAFLSIRGLTDEAAACGCK